MNEETLVLMVGADIVDEDEVKTLMLVLIDVQVVMKLKKFDEVDQGW